MATYAGLGSKRAIKSFPCSVQNKRQNTPYMRLGMGGKDSGKQSVALPIDCGAGV